jgi:hypothetical protein
MIQEPKPMHPNEIEAIFLQMRNNGEYYIGQLGGPPLSIYDWKKRELMRAQQGNESKKLSDYNTGEWK